MKKIFTNSELPHIWARQSQAEGKTSNGNLFFNGNKIYSYGHHFCIANIIKPGIVLFTNRKYSVSTSAHVSACSYACNHMEKIVIAHPSGSLNDNLLAFISEIKAALDVISSPRTRPQTKEFAKGELSSIVTRVARYLEATAQTISKKSSNDDVKKEFLLYLEAAKNEQAAKNLQAKLQRREAAKQKEIAKKNAAELAEQKQRLVKWRRGANIPVWMFNNIDSVYLRAKGDEIETSKGARVSLKSGQALYSAIKSGRDVKGYDIEGYTVISLNGVLKVGCHEIQRSEIDRFAKKQGW